MTTRAKVLLFAAVAVGLVFMMGWGLFRGAHKGGQGRHHLLLLQSRINRYDRMPRSAWPFLEALRNVQRSQGDLTPILQAQDARMDQDFAFLEASLIEELRLMTHADAQDAIHWEALEHEHIADLHAAQHRWFTRAKALAEVGEQLPHDVWWELFLQFEQDVGSRIEAAVTKQQERLEVLREELDRNGRRGQEMAVVLPVLALVVMLVLARAILSPLNETLRQLMAGVTRIAQGDFEHVIPVRGRDELATLSRAFNGMAHQLGETLQEKQRLMKAEAEASEREARRYSALLEETVRTRTAELAQANTQLQDSLRQLQETQEQLLFSDRLATVGRLTAGVAHEINNPLAYIRSNLHFALEELPPLLDADSREARGGQVAALTEALSEAREGVERVRSIVKDLKTLSRSEEMGRGPVDLGPVVQSAARMANHEIRSRARLVMDWEQVPPVAGDGMRLGQVFLNLLVNAAQAIPPDRVTENEIRVKAWASAPDRVTVAVSDTGCGIPPDVLPRIFDPFFTTKPVGEGTGLGLPVCRNILSALGGELSVESEVGRGTTFRVTLPAAGNVPPPPA